MMAGCGVDLYALCGWVTVMGGGAGYDGLTVYALRLADDGRTCAACECGTAPMAELPTVAVTAAATAGAAARRAVFKDWVDTVVDPALSPVDRICGR
eukprot:COSAG01_NODE_5151_length_4451_cov_74.855699_2_plen_97_part_00